MIARLRGRILKKDAQAVVVDVGGVGYGVTIPVSTFYRLGEPGAEGLLVAQIVVDGLSGDEAVVGHVRLAYRPERTRRVRRRSSSKGPSPSSCRALATPRSASERE